MVILLHECYRGEIRYGQTVGLCEGHMRNYKEEEDLQMEDKNLLENGARQEHPKPQMRRENWQNLNGEWDFAFDFGCSGVERKFYVRDGLDRKIRVPFCPESGLSGIGYRDFIPAVWYQRKVELGADQLKGRVRLHFGAVDYQCRLWVNGREAGSHKGGYVSFCFDITEYVREGENVLTL